MSGLARTDRGALTVVLLAVIALELALNRLLVPVLRPTDAAAGGWYEHVDRLALFIFYFASALAVAALARQLVGIGATVSRADRLARVTSGGLVATGTAFAVLGAIAIATPLTDGLTFAFQIAFTATLLFVLATQVERGGDTRTKIGIALVAIPLLVHAYGPLALRIVFDAHPSMGQNLPDGALHLPERLQAAGQWALVVAALVAPYCFAPRPLSTNALRPGPLIAAGAVAIVGAVIVRNHYEDGMRLAMRGFGIDLGPAAPGSLIALYLLALASITWTLVACWSAESAARRQIGIGLGLLATAGYTFSWPMMYLVPVAGLLAISSAARTVGQQEAAASSGGNAFRTPPIDDETWVQYIRSVVAALRGPHGDELSTSALTASGERDVKNTTVVTTRRGITITVRVSRAAGSIGAIDVQLGNSVDATAAPAWSLHARSERRMASGSHPAPPATNAPPVKTEDPAFDRRFRIRDRKAYTGLLLDDGLRARATALIDGWLAYWPGTCLYFRVVPGVGAPIDHPIPISELASRGDGSPDRLLSLIELLCDLGLRVALDELASAPAADDDGDGDAPASE